MELAVRRAVEGLPPNVRVTLVSSTFVNAAPEAISEAGIVPTVIAAPAEDCFRYWLVPPVPDKSALVPPYNSPIFVPCHVPVPIVPRVVILVWPTYVAAISSVTVRLVERSCAPALDVILFDVPAIVIVVALSAFKRNWL
jgi:hypothetical protein